MTLPSLPLDTGTDVLIFNEPNRGLVIFLIVLTIIAGLLAFAAYKALISGFFYLVALAIFSLPVGVSLIDPVIRVDRSRGEITAVRKLFFLIPVSWQTLKADEFQQVEIAHILFQESEAGTTSSHQQTRVKNVESRFPVRLTGPGKQIQIAQHDSFGEAAAQAQQLSAFMKRPLKLGFFKPEERWSHQQTTEPLLARLQRDGAPVLPPRPAVMRTQVQAQTPQRLSLYLPPRTAGPAPDFMDKDLGAVVEKADAVITRMGDTFAAMMPGEALRHDVLITLANGQLRFRDNTVRVDQILGISQMHPPEPIKDRALASVRNSHNGILDTTSDSLCIITADELYWVSLPAEEIAYLAALLKISLLQQAGEQTEQGAH